MVGPGSVSGPSAVCRDACSVRLTGPVTLTAEPDDGATFNGWEGLCEGSLSNCVVQQSGLATARFSAVIAIRIEGEGRVTAPGYECSGPACEWKTESQLSLSAIPEAGWRFVGFQGSCTGIATCLLSSGSVTARFERVTSPELVIRFEGDGAGSVGALDGSFECQISCRVQPTGAVQLRVSPAMGTTSFSLGGACQGQQPCVVTAPAEVVVSFERGRRVSVSIGGRGHGFVDVVASARRCPSDCDFFLDKRASLELRGRTEGAFSKPAAYDGGCLLTPDAGSCVIPAGQGDATVFVEFGSDLLMYQRFRAPGGIGDSRATIWLDEGGSVFLAVKTTRTLDWDGGLLSTSAATQHFTVLRLNPDAGLAWSTSSPAAQGDGGVLTLIPAQSFMTDAGLTILGNCIRSTGVCDGVVSHFAQEVNPEDGGLISLNGLFAPIGPIVSLPEDNERLGWSTTSTGGRLTFMESGVANAISLAVPGLAFISCTKLSEDLVCLVTWTATVIPSLPGCPFWTPLSQAGAPDVALISLQRDGSNCRILHEFRRTLSSSSNAGAGGSLLSLGGELVFPVVVSNGLVNSTPVTERFFARVSGGALRREPLPFTLPVTNAVSLRNGLGFSVRHNQLTPTLYQGVSVPNDSSALFLLEPNFRMRKAFVFVPLHNLGVRTSAANGRLAFVTIGTDLSLNGEPLTNDGFEYVHVFVVDDQ